MKKILLHQFVGSLTLTLVVLCVFYVFLKEFGSIILGKRDLSPTGEKRLVLDDVNKLNLYYKFRLSNRSNKVSNNLTFNFSLPVFASVNLVSIDLNIAPYANEIFEYRHEFYVLTDRGREGYGEFLGIAGHGEESKRRLQSILRSFTPDEEPFSEKIYQFIVNYVDLSGFHARARGAFYALDSGEADCTEYMQLFIALARTAGIPARGVIGYVYDRDTKIDPKDAHNWAEFWDGERWRVADPQRGVFMENEDHYIPFKILDDDGSYVGEMPPLYWLEGENIEGLELRMI
ncbi:transglutaminase-like domain-containing protein [Halioxenophilus aromaticivorans]|uniref:Transglutaminase-like domain-containing protein n=1 Tax=Halioxenophilus aromaticivorans TaxID=1306992 RepID=A0AAV3TYY3_9ALTE